MMGVGVVLRSVRGIIIVSVLVREFWGGDGKYGGGKGTERRCSCIYFASGWRGVEKFVPGCLEVGHETTGSVSAHCDTQGEFGQSNSISEKFYEIE
jgi:hypothetical protein